jgi:hypothetical protein
MIESNITQEYAIELNGLILYYSLVNRTKKKENVSVNCYSPSFIPIEKYIQTDGQN